MIGAVPAHSEGRTFPFRLSIAYKGHAGYTALVRCNQTFGRLDLVRACEGREPPPGYLTISRHVFKVVGSYTDTLICQVVTRNMQARFSTGEQIATDTFHIAAGETVSFAGHSNHEISDDVTEVRYAEKGQNACFSVTLVASCSEQSVAVKSTEAPIRLAEVCRPTPASAQPKVVSSAVPIKLESLPQIPVLENPLVTIEKEIDPAVKIKEELAVGLIEPFEQSALLKIGFPKKNITFSLNGVNAGFIFGRVDVSKSSSGLLLRNDKRQVPREAFEITSINADGTTEIKMISSLLNSYTISESGIINDRLESPFFLKRNSTAVFISTSKLPSDDGKFKAADVLFDVTPKDDEIYISDEEGEIGSSFDSNEEQISESEEDPNENLKEYDSDASYIDDKDERSSAEAADALDFMLDSSKMHLKGMNNKIDATGLAFNKSAQASVLEAAHDLLEQRAAEITDEFCRKNAEDNKEWDCVPIRDFNQKRKILEDLFIEANVARNPNKSYFGYSPAKPNPVDAPPANKKKRVIKPAVQKP